MNCNSALSQLSAYVDGELAGKEMYAIRAHLQDCDSCAEEARFIASMKSALTELPAFEPSEDLEERLVEAVFAKSRKKHAPIFTRSLAYVSGFAFAAALFSGLLMLQQDRQQKVADNKAAGQSVRFEMARDQAYLIGGDPLSGSGAVIPANYDAR